MHTTFDDVIEKLDRTLNILNSLKGHMAQMKLQRMEPANALAQFIRTMIIFQLKFNQYIVGSYTCHPSEQLGFDIFNNEKGDCFHCHGAASSGYQIGAFKVITFQ